MELSLHPVTIMRIELGKVKVCSIIRDGNDTRCFPALQTLKSTNKQATFHPFRVSTTLIDIANIRQLEMIIA